MQFHRGPLWNISFPFSRFPLWFISNSNLSLFESSNYFKINTSSLLGGPPEWKENYVYMCMNWVEWPQWFYFIFFFKSSCERCQSVNMKCQNWNRHDLPIVGRLLNLGHCRMCDICNCVCQSISIWCQPFDIPHKPQASRLSDVFYLTHWKVYEFLPAS